MVGATGLNPGITATGGLSGGGLSGNKIPKGYKQGQLQQYTPEQMQLYGQQFAHVSPESYTGRLAAGDEDIFNQIEAPAFRQFNQLQGQLGSRFSGMGSRGSRRSSGFQNTAGQLGSDFAQDLASRRQELQRQAINDLMGFSDQLLGQRPYQQFLVEKPPEQKKAGWGGALSGGLKGASTGAALGPYGALAGGLIGGTAGYFSKGGGDSGGSGINFGNFSGLFNNQGSGSTVYNDSGYNALPGLEDAFRTGNYGGL